MKDGEQNPKKPGMIYSESAGGFVSRAEYNATRPDRDQEYRTVQERILRIWGKRENGDDGPLDYFNLQHDLILYILNYCTDQNVLNLMSDGAGYLLSKNLETVCNSHRDKHGLTAREDRHKDMIRYFLVEQFNERGYTSAKPGMNNKVARAYARAMMQDQQMPAGQGRDGKPLTDEALKAAVKRVRKARDERARIEQQIQRAAKNGDLEKKLQLVALLDEDPLPDWAITDSERQRIRDRITLGYIGELQRKFPNLPRLK